MDSVKLYTAPMCSRCIRMKEFLNFIDVSYDEASLKEDRTAFSDIDEHVEAPVLVVGDDHVVRFDRERIVEVLRNNGFEVDLEPETDMINN